MVYVDKTNRTIKAILDKSIGEGWPRGGPGLRGREITVEEVDPSWTFETYFEPQDPIAHWVSPDGKSGQQLVGERGIRGKRGRQLPAVLAPTSHFALVLAQTPKGSTRTVSIYIPQLDHGQMDVARDALLVGDKNLIATALEPFGLYAGIARAILERQIRSFAKAANPKKSTKQIRREVDDFLRAQGRL